MIRFLATAGATAGALATVLGFVGLIVGGIGRIPRVRKWRKALADLQARERHEETKNALDEVLANGNPITVRLDENAVRLGELGVIVTAHIQSDSDAFARLEAAAGSHSTAVADVGESLIRHIAAEDQQIAEIGKRSRDAAAAALIAAKLLAADAETAKNLAAEDRAQLARLVTASTDAAALAEGVASDLAAMHGRADETEGDPGAAADAAMRTQGAPP